MHHLGTNISTINHLYILQKKALRIINFKGRNAHSSPLFHYSKIIKIEDKVKIENCLFIKKYTNNKLPSISTNWCTFSSFASKGNLQIPSLQATSHGKNAFVYMVIRTWNYIQKEMKGVMLYTFSLAKLKSLLIEFYLNMYKTSSNFLLLQFFFSKIILYSLPLLQILSNHGHSKLRIELSLSVACNHILL